MKLIAAYLLALLGGNSSPTAEDLKSVLGSVGAEADDEKLELLFSNLKGKDLGEVLAIGRERFASSGGGGGGGGGVVTAASGGGGGGGAAAPPVEEKKEDKKEEKEESDDDMGFSLFD